MSDVHCYSESQLGKPHYTPPQSQLARDAIGGLWEIEFAGVQLDSFRGKLKDVDDDYYIFFNLFIAAKHSSSGISYGIFLYQGRNVEAVLSMMKHIEAFNNSLKGCSSQDDDISDPISTPITVSVELEKPNEQLLDLLPYVDIAFVGRTFAEFRGCDNMSETLRSISQEAKSGWVGFNLCRAVSREEKPPEGTYIVIFSIFTGQPSFVLGATGARWPVPRMARSSSLLRFPRKK